MPKCRVKVTDYLQVRESILGVHITLNIMWEIIHANYANAL